MIASMLLIDGSGKPVLTMWFVISAAVVVAVMLVTHWRLRHKTLHEEVQRWPALTVGLAWGVMLWLIVTTQGGGNAFIYFQF